jgi:hypothetical protein
MKKKSKVLMLSLILAFGGMTSMTCGEENFKENSSINEGKELLAFLKNDTNKMKKDMIAHLEKKYGEKFIPLYFLAESGWDRMTFYKEGTNPKTDYAYIYREKEHGKVVYRDNYFGLIIREEYENLVKKEVEKVYGECKVYSETSNDYFPDELNKRNNYQDALEKMTFFEYSSRIYIKSTGKTAILNDKIDILVNNFKKNNLNGIFSLYYMKTGHYEDLDRSNHDEYVKEYTKGFDDVCYENLETSARKLKSKK